MKYPASLRLLIKHMRLLSVLRDRAIEVEARALEMPGNGWRAIQQSQFRRLQTALRHIREFEKQITPE